jgi:6-phosphogluconolactonase
MGYMRLSRRAFVQSVSYVSAVGAVSGLMPAKYAFASSDSRIESAGFAYVGSGLDGGQIHVFATRGHRWKLAQRVASRSPVSIVLHRNGQFIYVLNQVDQTDGLPCGSIEAYKIEPRSGRIALINRRNLALSAICPRHLAISPDGTCLVVAVHGGGSYNVLPIGADGALGLVSARLKETGSGPHGQYQDMAHPHTVIVDAKSDSFIATDSGSDRLSVFQFERDLSQGRPVQIGKRQSIELPAGSGPSHAVLHPENSILYVANGLSSPSIAGYSLNSATGEIKPAAAAVRVEQEDHPTAWHDVSLAIQPKGDFLYSAISSLRNGTYHGSVAAWRIDRISGGLSRIHTWNASGQSLDALTCTDDGGSLLAIDKTSGSVVSFALDGESGRPGQSSVVAEVPSPISLAIKASYSVLFEV